jgi:hypothetical protein
MLAGVQFFGWLLSLLAALLLTLLQYGWIVSQIRNKTLQEKRWFIPLFLRFIAWFILFILLQSPWIRISRSVEVKPRMVLYLDSSESVSTRDKSMLQLASDRLILELPFWNIEKKYFGSDVRGSGINPVDVSVNNSWYKASNFQHVFEDLAQEKFKHGLEAAVFMSDGIANAGLLPRTLKSPEGVMVSAFGVGDTALHADVFVKSVLLNKEIYIGNSGELELVVGVRNVTSLVTADVTVQGNTVGTQSFIPSGKYQAKRLIFSIPKQTKIGLKSVRVALRLSEPENVVANNSRFSAFTVVDNRKIIGLLGDFLEPDIGALRRSLQGYDPLECKVLNSSDFEKSGIDALILLGVPASMGSVKAVAPRLKQWVESGKSLFIIPKKESDLLVINELSKSTRLLGNAVWQEAQAFVNPGYSGFSMDEPLGNRWRKFPPLHCPLLNFTIADRSKVLLYQRWSAMETEIPMQWIEPLGTGNLMVCLGSGFWRWGLFEQKNYSDQEGFQQWVRRSLGVLTAGINSKQRLDIVLGENQIEQGNAPLIRVVYRDLDGGINTKEIPKLTISEIGSDGESNQDVVKGNPISVTLQKNETGFLASSFALKSGIYRLDATVTVGGEKFSDRELLMVNNVSVEKLNSTSELGWMKQVSKSTGGLFAYLDTSGSEKSKLGKFSNDAVTKMIMHIKSQVQANRIIKEEIRNWYWYELVVLMLILVGCLTLEWSFRKWLGKY